ncbi:luciferase family protein [Salinirubrum litoreum]|uniref:Luciferase family protein n=1 Tax=Salinirubrum litoreum TaxID=1126234 RepID=A0ABD5R8R7_9EURY|nr:luciferase family protein [Salinirubrum litoreum]
MHRVTRSSDADPTERLIADAESWPGVETAPHRFSATEFRLFGREFGHVHRGGVLDVNFPKPVRDHLIESKYATRHRFAPDTGWTTYDLRTPDDLDGGLWLLRLAYTYRLATKRTRPEAEDLLEDVDLDAEIRALGLDSELSGVFERLLAR